MRNLSRFYLFLLLLLFINAVVWADVSYTTFDPKTYLVTQRVEVTNYGGTATNLRITTPLLMTEGLPPYQKVVQFDYYPSQIRILKQNANGMTAEYLHPSLAQGQSVTLEFSYRIMNLAIAYSLEPLSGKGLTDLRFLQPEPGIESNANSILSMASRLTAEETTQLGKARKIFAYVNNLNYETRDLDSLHTALNTLDKGKGNCEDFSLLYIALCRAAGIPARFVSGYRFEPARINSYLQTDLEQFGHAWVELNLPESGWVTVDPTFVYTYNGVKKVNYDYFGKIQSEDRHLFYNYSRQIAPAVTWQYNPQKPSQIELNRRSVILQR